MSLISTVVRGWGRGAGRDRKQPVNLRARFASGLRGTGVEIGALANPLWLPPGASVTFVDKFDYDKLCSHNPDVPAETIRRPDVICDTASLDALPDAAYDFLIGWHRVLKPGGLALCILPDARYTFDRGRPLTGLDHLLWDFANAGTEMKRLSDLAHIAECNLNMHASLTLEGALEVAQAILRDSYDTHFHVWTHDSFRIQLATLGTEYGLPFAVRDSACDEHLEMLFLLEALPRTPSRLDDASGVAPRALR